MVSSTKTGPGFKVPSSAKVNPSLFKLISPKKKKGGSKKSPDLPKSKVIVIPKDKSKTTQVFERIQTPSSKTTDLKAKETLRILRADPTRRGLQSVFRRSPQARRTEEALGGERFVQITTRQRASPRGITGSIGPVQDRNTLLATRISAGESKRATGKQRFVRDVAEAEQFGKSLVWPAARLQLRTNPFISTARVVRNPSLSLSNLRKDIEDFKLPVVPPLKKISFSVRASGAGLGRRLESGSALALGETVTLIQAPSFGGSAVRSLGKGARFTAKASSRLIKKSTTKLIQPSPIQTIKITTPKSISVVASREFQKGIFVSARKPPKRISTFVQRKLPDFGIQPPVPKPVPGTGRLVKIREGRQVRIVGNTFGGPIDIRYTIPPVKTKELKKIDIQRKLIANRKIRSKPFVPIKQENFRRASFTKIKEISLGEQKIISVRKPIRPPQNPSQRRLTTFSSSSSTFRPTNPSTRIKITPRLIPSSDEESFFQGIEINTGLGQGLRINPSFKQASFSQSKTKNLPIQKPRFKTSLFPIQNYKIYSDIKTKQRSIGGSGGKPGPGRGGVKKIKVPPPPDFDFKIKTKVLKSRSLKLKTIKPRFNEIFTPSLEALALNIRGPARSIGVKGIGLRPIPIRR